MPSNYELYLSKLLRRKKLKSRVSTQKCHFRLKNLTNEKCLLFWVDFQGELKIYNNIPPGNHFDVDTFKHHVWLAFTSKRFKNFCYYEILNLHSKPIMISKKSTRDQNGKLVRSTILITRPKFTLKELALRTVAFSIFSSRQFSSINLENVTNIVLIFKYLNLPRMLITDLYDFLEETIFRHLLFSRSMKSPTGNINNVVLDLL